MSLWDNVVGLLHSRVCSSTGRVLAWRTTGKSRLKSVEIQPFIGTKHCQEVSVTTVIIQWPQWWCSANGQSLLKWQKVTSLLQKSIGIPDLMTCNSTEFVVGMGSNFEPTGRSSPERPGWFQDPSFSTHLVLCCADSCSEGFVSGIPPSLIWEVFDLESCSKNDVGNLYLS